MGYFDLPTGELELNLKPKKKGAKENGWTSVMFTDGLSKEDIATSVEEWSINYRVLEARYNCRPVTIPKKYHWELRSKEECFGIYKSRADAVKAMQERKAMRWEDKTVKVGLPYFVED